jgi:hypothetical protein
MQTIAEAQRDLPLATSAVVTESAGVGSLTLKASPPGSRPQPAPVVLLPAWELRGGIIDKMA